MAAKITSETDIATHIHFFHHLLNDDLRVQIRVTGQSMHPTICSGDVVILKKVPHTGGTFGDILLCLDNTGNPILHRLLSKKKRKTGRVLLTIKGDALWRPDEMIPENQVLAKVAAIKKKWGVVNLNSFPWRFITILLTAYHCGKAFIYKRYLAKTGTRTRL